jgi:carboxylesterase
MHWQDWLASVEDGYHLLKGCVDQVFVIGLSMGGILSLIFTLQHDVSGVVAMSTPYSLPDDPRLPLLTLFAGLVPKIKKGPPDWQNPDAAKDHVEYPYLPTRGVVQLRDLLAVMRSALPSVTVPALIIHSKHDGSLPPRDAEKIFAAIGSQKKQLFWVENSGHVITREPDRLLAFAKVDEFIRMIQNPPQPA